MNKKPIVRLVNIAFILICGSILIFLLRAPEETTALLPKDDNHIRFYQIHSKKEAEEFCNDCHGTDAASALSKEHPPSYRCLF